MLQATARWSRDPISACASLSLPIEGVCSDLVPARRFRISRRGVARVCTGDLSLISVMHCVVKTCLQAL
jgi:hypothetical protein